MHFTAGFLRVEPISSEPVILWALAICREDCYRLGEKLSATLITIPMYWSMYLQDPKKIIVLNLKFKLFRGKN